MYVIRRIADGKFIVIGMGRIAFGSLPSASLFTTWAAAKKELGDLVRNCYVYSAREYHIQWYDDAVHAYLYAGRRGGTISGDIMVATFI